MGMILADGSVSPLNQGMDVWEKYSWAGLGAFLLLFVLLYHFYAARRSEKALLDLSIRCVEAMEKMTAALESQTKSVDSLKASTELAGQKAELFLQYMRGRDANGSHT